MKRPQSLFKYESINQLSLRNLKNAKVFFNKPENFNDPFDSAVQVFRFSDDELVYLNNKYAKDERSPFKHVTSVEQIAPQHRNEIRRSWTSVTEKIINRQKNIGVSCFTEVNNSILMWSHYGNMHRGMCVEFDASSELFEKSYPVKYSDEYPIGSLMHLSCKSDDEIFNQVLTKYKSWSYEKEWRIMHNEPNTLFGYSPEIIKGIYFGVNVDRADLEIVCLIMRGQSKAVKFYRGVKNDQKYEIDFEEFKYIPCLLGKELGLR